MTCFGIPSVEGLTVRSAWAWTDTGYSEDFVNATGENLKGEDGAGSADITGYVGFTYDSRTNRAIGVTTCLLTPVILTTTLGQQP